MVEANEPHYIEFSYMYRDAANYKNCSYITFTNLHSLLIAEIDKRLRAAFEQETDFIAEQIGVPEMFFEDEDDDDHCWHEYDGVEAVIEIPSDLDGRDIRDFIEKVELESKKGWKEYDVNMNYEDYYFLST